MKNLFTSLAVALTLVFGSALTASAQTTKAVPARAAVAAETTGMAPASTTTKSETAAPAASEADTDSEQSNIVLFTGTIKHDKLKALPGATVYVKSTKQMAVADENGDFSMELDFSNGPIDLEVSYAGYEDQSIAVTDPNLFLVVSMNPRKKK